MNNLDIYPTRLRGEVNVPPSKSQAHRLLLAAALADGTCTIRNIQISDDIFATLNVVKALGNDIKLHGKGKIKQVEISKNKNAGKNTLINCKESGSTLRFSIPVFLAKSQGGTFTGEGRLGSRPLTPYKEICKKNQIRWQQDKKKGLPLTVLGKLNAGKYRIPGKVSSQFITGLMFALPLLDNDSIIEVEGALESAPYVDITMNVLDKFNVKIDEVEKRKRYRIIGGQTYKKTDCITEGDWSQAAFHIAAGLLGDGVSVKGLNIKSVQGDRIIVDYVKKMGGSIFYNEDEEVLTVKRSRLIGGNMDISQCPDLAPVLVLLCAIAKGKSRIKGAKRLRLKESDRINTITSALTNLGARIKTTSDEFIIEGINRLKGGVVSSGGDHRIAMMTAVAASACNGVITLKGANAVEKSYPDFWEDYKLLGGKIK